LHPSKGGKRRARKRLSYAWNRLKSTAFARSLSRYMRFFMRGLAARLALREVHSYTNSLRCLKHSRYGVPKSARCILSTTRAVRSHLSFEPSQRVVSSDEPRTKREKLHREASPSLPFILLQMIVESLVVSMLRPSLPGSLSQLFFSVVPQLFLSACQGLAAIRACESREGYSGFGCAAIVSRNVFTLLLSMIAVPVSTKVGIGAVGAVRQSLNSCTALWCKSSANLIA